MSNTPNSRAEALPSSPEDLLPWYVTGRLSAADKAAVDEALTKDAELRRRLLLVRAEEAETVAINEDLGTPSAKGLDALFSKIDAYEAAFPRRAPLLKRLFTPLSRWVSSLSPDMLGLAATAACLAFVVETGLLTSLLADREKQQSFETAQLESPQGPSRSLGSEPSAPKLQSVPVAGNGTYALVSFISSAPIEKLTNFLVENNAVLLDGPKPGGFYRIQISPEKLSTADLNKALNRLRARTDLVDIAVAEGK